MNSLRSGLTVAAIVLGTMTALAAENMAGNSRSTASGTAGYAVMVPSGDNWESKSSADGMVYENVIDGPKLRHSNPSGIPPFVFYRAGFSAAPAPAFTDRASFLAYVKQAVAETADKSSFAKVQDTFTEKEQDGLWLVDYRTDREGGMMIYEGANRDTRVTLIRTRYALDPREPGRVLIVWYAFQGVRPDEKRFESEAAGFLNSLRKTSQ